MVFRMQAHLYLTQINNMSILKLDGNPDNSENNFYSGPP